MIGNWGARKLLYYRDTEDTEKAHPSVPTEADAVSNTIEAQTDFDSGLGQPS
jgi:hypothetical protein